ncbi:sorting nexin-19 isoform X2 [Engraulis encrasicolus]|uniref:sorting nexin-19 isoform X2 n=1 Tax=Engraulis encrasicolus TaxID=184585 RepID=UPI002FD6FAD0
MVCSIMNSPVDPLAPSPSQPPAQAQAQAQAQAPSGGLGAMLTQKRLFGIGAFLGWIVLFHLMVNVWLLCVFTSLLVVLGAWVASQVILDSERVVHLERFFTLERIASSEESEWLLDREIESTVAKIIRDFVSSWYGTVSSEPAFEMEVQRAMIAMAMELKLRSMKVDTKVLTQRVLDLFGGHLQSYIKAKQNMVKSQQQQQKQQTKQMQEDGGSHDSMWELYCKESPPHPAVQSSAVEVNYARAIVDLLLHVLVPPPHLETRTGRFVVGELITCNVLLPLISKLSDPDWLNMSIVEIFTRSADPVVTPASNNPPVEPPAMKPSATREAHKVLPPTPKKAATVPLIPLRPADKTDGLGNVEIATVVETPAVDVKDSAVITNSQQFSNSEEVEAARPALDLTEGPALIVRRPMDFLRPGKSNPFYQENDSDLDSPLLDGRKGSTESLVLISPIHDVNGQTKDEVLAVDAVAELEEGVEEGVEERAMGDGMGEEEVDEEEEEEGGDVAEFAGTSCPEVSFPPKVLIGSKEGRRGSVSASDMGSRTEESSSFCNLHELDSECPSVERGMLSLEVPGMETVAMTSPNELAVPTPLLASSPSTGVGLMPSGSFTFDPLCSPEGPVIIQNLRITGTITAKEHRGTGSHPYTLYTVKYETSMEPENPCSVAYHMVNRRYSEFLNLQTRLEEKPELRKIIKNVKGPKKIFPDLPFGNMDSDKVEARKSLLENFLKQLCAIPETANSDEMQEFLALNTDARIAFVKKPLIVSRIDKIVMNAIVDTLKTAFPRSEPQSPTEDMDVETDGKLDKKSKSRLRFSSKTAPALIVTDIMPKVLYCFDEQSTVFNGRTVDGLEAFIEEQEALAAQASSQEATARGEGGLAVKQGETLKPVCESCVSEVALDLLCLLLREQCSWLCQENTQRAIRLLFGTLIDRWLEVQVCNLTCTQYWVTYLRVLQEAVWPGGRLPLSPRPQRSPEQQKDTRRQSLVSLMDLLPDMVSDVMGAEKYRLSWQTVLDSLQNQHINRHLVYCIWDLLLELVVPEAAEESLQKSLLHSLSKNADKLLP